MKIKIKEQQARATTLKEAYVDESKLKQAAILLKALMSATSTETSHLNSSINNFKSTIEGLVIAGQAIAAAPTISIESAEFSQLCRDRDVATTALGIFDEWFASEPHFLRPLAQTIAMYSAQVGQSTEPQNPAGNLNPTVAENALQESRKRLQRNAGIKIDKVEENMFAKWKAYKAR
jgi:hypothetical protein